MKTKLSHYRISLIVLFLLFFIAGNAQQPAASIPEFSFERQDRSVFTKKDIPSSSIAFFVFFDTECDHCRHAVEYLNDHLQELTRAKLYLITLDNRDKVATFLGRYGSKLKKNRNAILLFDTKNQFITRFGPRKYPSLMLYSKDGKLLLYDDEEKNLPRFMEKIRCP